MKALYAKFAPNGTKASRRKKDRHRLTGRITCRLEDTDMEALQQRMKADGYATAQELMTDPGAPVSCWGGGSVNYDLPDHPVVQNLERTGYPDGKEPRYPSAAPSAARSAKPSTKTDTAHTSAATLCMETKDAWEVEDCFPERSEDA